MNGSNEDIFREELNRMEMLRPDRELSSLYFVQDKEQAEPKIRIALEQAEKYQADAVFFRIFPNATSRSSVPQIYIYHDNSLSFDESKYAELHRRLWNAGIPPLVFILTADQIKILNCRQEPEIDKNSKQPLFTPFDKLETMLAADRAFAAREIASRTLWENPAFKNDFLLEKTAYFKLLSHLKVFRNKLLQRKILLEQTVNRLLVMAILVKYLNDRQDSDGNRIFTKGFLRQFSHTNKDDIASLFSEKGSCISFFDHLSKHFNGGIFELPKKEKEELEQADLAEVAAFLRGDQEPKSGQLLFWPLYSFEDLPVELISNIYEEFLAEKNKGVVYTPPMLVDFLLDQSLPLNAESLSWKILDPACGSGVFLVGAFKRLIQCWRIANNWKKPSYKELQKILKNNIFGIDKASEAVLVTAFSLCVALCDELEPLVIWKKLKFDNLQDRNLLDRDFFEVVQSEELNNHFDLVIGNPPFDSRLTTDAAKQIEKMQVKERPKLPDTQLALLFLEQSFKVARKEATVCLIQPAGPLLYNGKALPFRSYLFEQFAINQVFDFTALEGILFKAKVATAAIMGLNTPPTNEKILHLTFRRTKALKEKLLFEVDPYDFHWVSRESVKQKQYIWKTNLLGGGRLHRMLDRLLRDAPTLGEYLEEKRENHGWQFGEGYSVGCGSTLNRQANVEKLIELSPREHMKNFGLKRTPKLAPWITGKPNVPSTALTTDGIDWDHIQPVDKLFFEEPRRRTQLIFSAPHVLIREIVDEVAIPAMYTEKSSVFTNQIIGVHAPENESNQLNVLAERLNNSKLFGILAILISGRILVGRANSLYVSDIMALPYPDDIYDIDLAFWEQALVEDIADYLVDFQRKGEKAAVLSKTDESDLQNFGKMYCDILNPVYKEFHPLQPIPLGSSFICYPFCYGDAPQIELPDKKHVVPFLDELLHSRHSSRLFINRILRLYEQNVIFMVKPNQKRYWLRSIALRDADETLIDLLEQGC
jgi:type I restriction-modification system DNA methylase subunit